MNHSTIISIIAAANKATKESPTGATFVGVKNYTTQKNETADYTFILGASYDKAKAKDIAKLQNFDVNKIKLTAEMVQKGVTIEMLETAKAELIASLEKPDANRSAGQIEAYTQIIDGMKYHNETFAVSLYGYQVQKKVRIKGIYKEVNSSAKTLAKNAIKKAAKLRTEKFRQFNLTDEQIEIAISGKRF